MVNGAAAVDSLDGEDDVPDAEVGLLVVDPDEVVVLLLNETARYRHVPLPDQHCRNQPPDTRSIPASYIVDLSAEKG